MVASPGSPTVWAAAGVPARPIVVKIPSAAAAPAAATRREKFRKACSLRVATENHQREIPLRRPSSANRSRFETDLGDGNSHWSPSRAGGAGNRFSRTHRRVAYRPRRVKAEVLVLAHHDVSVVRGLHRTIRLAAAVISELRPG